MTTPLPFNAKIIRRLDTWYLIAMMDNIWWLDVYLPPGIYCIFNPYQESHGVVAQLLGAVQKLNNIHAAHPGLHPIHYALQEEPFGNTICIAVFWFGEGYPYSAVLCSPFGNSDDYDNHIIMVKHASETAGVLHEWTQVILFGGVHSNH